MVACQPYIARFGREHQALRVTLAMGAGVTITFRVEEIVGC